MIDLTTHKVICVNTHDETPVAGAGDDTSSFYCPTCSELVGLETASGSNVIVEADGNVSQGSAL